MVNLNNWSPSESGADFSGEANEEIRQWVDNEMQKLRGGPNRAKWVGDTLQNDSAAEEKIKKAGIETFNQVVTQLQSGKGGEVGKFLDIFRLFKNVDFIKLYSENFIIVRERQEVEDAVENALKKVKESKVVPEKGKQVLNRPEDIKNVQAFLGMEKKDCTGKWDDATLKKLKEQTKETKQLLGSEANDLDENATIFDEKVMELIKKGQAKKREMAPIAPPEKTKENTPETV